MEAPRLRFAPSPTGDLHLGSALVAVANAIARDQAGGALILRIDDTDGSRTIDGAEERLTEALRWLGIRFDESPVQGGPCGPYRQSERADLHRRYASAAVEGGAARRLPDGAVVLDAPAADVTIVDLTRGPIRVRGRSLGETVLLRSSGEPTYHLATVVDDAEMRISHVVRGEDHVTNTARQAVIAAALGLPEPLWAHLPLLAGSDGRPLSKRDAATGIASLRERGVAPEAVWSVLARLACPAVPSGTSDHREIERLFDLRRLGRGLVRVDPGSFGSASRDALDTLPDSEFLERIARDLAQSGLPVQSDRIRPLLPGLRGSETVQDAAATARDVFVAAAPVDAEPSVVAALAAAANRGLSSGEEIVAAVLEAVGGPRRPTLHALRGILLGGRRGVPVALAIDALGPDEVARRARRAAGPASSIREDTR